MKAIVASSLLLLFSLLFSTCQNKPEVLSSRREIPLQYATLLQLTAADSFTIATIREPHDTTKILQRYCLLEKDVTPPKALPKATTIIRIPLQRAAVFSSVHLALLQELHAIRQVRGICDIQYIIDQNLQALIRHRRLTNYGGSLRPDLELLVATRADALLVSSLVDVDRPELRKTGIPIIECADYLETSALGRAEWIKFFGLLFGQRQAADSIFQQVEDRYQSLTRQVRTLRQRPSLLVETKKGGVWYVPGGKSTMGEIYQAAGANYLFSYLNQSGSVALSFETIYKKALNADFWLIKYGDTTSLSYQRLKASYTHYSAFKAFRQHNIYACNTLQKSFYEETPFHPERLLEDLIKLFHPQLLPDHRLRYFEPLQ
ncbi:ABC transporter substrate-binding protein [Alloprevotella tannerae]|uniref:ABC transporter substrate-binding protein n=1 Tax=Alloprevotella tannerae TaxID=76122 RepID=A0A929S0V5_9BACT|nr:ABC transporter substrate-binding protein [Alloprevotella tannerae]MBF0971209.1 ABC transporter substrate-binding protein [Alloprevotella tannerae]